MTAVFKDWRWIWLNAVFMGQGRTTVKSFCQTLALTAELRPQGLLVLSRCCLLFPRSHPCLFLLPSFPSAGSAAVEADGP